MDLKHHEPKLRREEDPKARKVACSQCNKMFRSTTARNTHMKTHTGERPYPCPQCKHRFAHKGNLTSHVLTVHRASEERTHWCPEPGCVKVYRNPRSLRSHLKTHAETRPTYPCPTCGKLYNSKQGLDGHINFGHGVAKKEHKCTYCANEYHTMGQLLKHTRRHTGEKPYTCVECFRSFQDKVGLGRHKTRVHGNLRAYSCPTCGSLFKESSKLKRHMEMHKSEEERQMFECTECGKKLTTKPGLESHMAVHMAREDYRHTCPACNKKFPRLGALNRHVQSHTGEKPYACSMCSRKCGNRDELRTHMTGFHSNERPHSCPQCDNSFKTSPDLKKHMETHKTAEERKMFECKDCGKKLMAKAGLKLHMMHVHRDREESKHSCSYCDKKFVTPGDLRRHVVVHTGEKPHVCSECGREFGLRENLRRHQRDVHGNFN